MTEPVAVNGVRGLFTRASRTLPAGTAVVALGLGVLGIAAYVFLAVAGHALTPADYSALSVLWVIVFAVGPGLFFPLEQELSRVVSVRTQAGEGPGAVVARVAILAGGVLVVLLASLTVATPWLADRLFNGHRALVAALELNLIALSLAHLSRGVLAGTGRFTRYGSQLAIDGALRCAAVVMLAATGAGSPTSFGFALAAAQLISVAVTAADLVRMPAGSAVTWRQVSAGLGLLLVSTLLSQLVVNIGVVVAKLLAGDAALAGEILSGSVLARLPLFLYASLQASLLPSLSRAVAAGDSAGYARQLKRGLQIVALLGGAGMVGCAALGPTLSRLLFHRQGALGPIDFLWLSGATTAYMVALVLGQGTIALGQHRSQAVAWTAGFLTLLAATAAPVSVLLKVELGYAVGSLVVVTVLGARLAGRARATARPFG